MLNSTQQMYKGFLPLIKDKKQPTMKFKGKTQNEFYKYEGVRKLEAYSGILADDIVMVDIDNVTHAQLLKKIVIDLSVNCNILKTDNGMHFYFKNTNINRNRSTKTCIAAIGINTMEIKLGIKNTSDPLKIGGVKREWLQEVKEIDALPKWLHPIKRVENMPDFLEMAEGDGRNQSLFNYILTLQDEDFSRNIIKEIIVLINRYILKKSLPQRELDTILRDEAFNKPRFYSGSKLLHHNFARFIRNEEHIIKIDNVLHMYGSKEGIYTSKNIESVMIKHLPELTRTKRLEIMTYLEIICENTVTSCANFIAVRNGILDIKAKELRSFSPDIIIQNYINFNYLPDSYDSTVDKTLNKICCNDNNLRLLLEEMVGYTLFRRNELGVCFILTGDGKNGKSTFLYMIKQLLGESNISALALEELGQRFKTAELFGKLANIGDDIGDKFIDDDSIFKKLVTGEAINVERKGRDPFNFNNYAKFLFSTNKMPRIKDTSYGLKRRLIIVPFDAQFEKSAPEYDAFIKDKLLTKSAIEYLLRLGIEGLKRVLENGFTTVEKVTKALEEYEEINNPVISFVKDFGEEKILHQPTKDIHRAYQVWCVENGLQSLSNIAFSREVCKKLGFETIRPRINGQKTYVFSKRPEICTV